MKTLARLFLRIEAGFHYADAYLAYHRGEHVLASECENRARDCERRMDILEVNHG